MKIFLTGATGFIGTHLAGDLASRGHDLVCLARRSSNILELENIGVEPVLGDVQDRRSLLTGMSGCEALVHLAAATSFWEHDREIYSRVNTEGTRNVMECALESNISRVVHMSTLHIYGRPARRPFDEQSMVGPVRFSEYARTKYEAERIAWGLHIRKGLPLVVCCPAIVLGARSSGGGTSFVERLLDAVRVHRALLNSVHTFVHVRDVVDAVGQILSRPFPAGQRYFIAGECISIRRLATMLEASSGAKLSRGAMSGSAVRIVGTAFAAMAGILGKPPFRGLSPDYLATLREGISADGGKAARELGITYTPIAQAISDELRSVETHGLLTDKRRARRNPILLEIVYKAQGDDTSMPGYVTNISESGMFLITRKPYAKGRYISANLSGKTPGKFFMARGRVVRASPDGVAVDFTHKDRNIRGLVCELGKRPSLPQSEPRPAPSRHGRTPCKTDQRAPEKAAAGGIGRPCLREPCNGPGQRQAPSGTNP